MKIFKEITFDAAHFLPNYVGKCKNLHGHTYKLKITIETITAEPSGMGMDLAYLSEILQNEIIHRLDHRNLNDLIENPTAEHLAIEICKLLAYHKDIQYALNTIELWETPTSGVLMNKNDIMSCIAHYFLPDSTGKLRLKICYCLI